MRKLFVLMLISLLPILINAQQREKVKDTITANQTEQLQHTASPKKQSEKTVIICLSESSYAYHTKVCGGLSRCKAGTSKVTVSEAKDRGYRACKICY